MSDYLIPSLLFDVFYLFDLICDFRCYAFYDKQDELVTDPELIVENMVKQKVRILAKLILCLPFYLISYRLYPIKFISAIHFRTIYVLF